MCLAWAPTSCTGESASSVLGRWTSPETSLLSDNDHYNDNKTSYGRLKSKILKIAWGSCNLPSPFLFLLMTLLVRCCQHAKGKKFPAPKDLQAKDLILHTVVYDCTQAYMCWHSFPVCLLMKMLKIAVYSRKAPTYIKSNCDRLIEVCIFEYQLVLISILKIHIN